MNVPNSTRPRSRRPAAVLCAAVACTLLPAVGRAQPAAAEPADGLLFREGFDDDQLLRRGWYDGRVFVINRDRPKAGAGCLEYHWVPDTTTPIRSSPVRRRFEPTNTVYLRFDLRLSKGWGWSGRPFHPHLIYFLTTENGPFQGPAASRLTLYVEPQEGRLRLAAQDIQNRDAPHGPSQGPLRGGYNGKFFDSRDVLFTDDTWHRIEVLFRLNTLDLARDRPNADGIARAWVDGRLVVDRADLVFRTTDYPNMKFNQILIGPYFGPGLLPHEQSLWIDEMVVGTRRIEDAAAAPAPAGGGAALRVPPGFEVRRAAAEGAVRFPMFAAFDDRGRLYVAESSGLDLYAEIAAGTRKCRISVLEDADDDGHFESARVFADRLVFPMGLAWRDGRLYVADPPDLVALEDTDNDGRADRRTTILTGFGHIDNGSLHGLIFGPDGLLYMTMGTPDGYRLARPDGSHVEGKSGALIRCRPDGSQSEVVCRGFVNLVEAAFLPGGDAIGTDNWFQEPAEGARDALVHLVEGGLYPFAPDEGTPQPVTGPPLPPVARFPAVALSGLERAQGTTLPPEYRGNLFSAQHNARKVARHRLIPDGATFQSEDHDFLTSDDPDFHPSDVLQDADGSLLVLDTGAWYVQHCPTGRIRASDAPGGIYRVRPTGAPRPADPRGLRIAWDALGDAAIADLLADPRPAVRNRAGRTLAARGGAANLAALLAADGPPPTDRGSTPTRDPPPLEAQLEAIWALASIPQPDALPPLRRALADPDEDVACAAARALARRVDRGAQSELVRLLVRGSPRARLAAAEALARCGSPDEALTAIWRGLADAPDRFLRHALIHAAHRLADAEALEAALGRPEPAVQAAALLLLDQPPRPPGRLGPDPVVARLDAEDEGLRSAALHVLMRHPEWSGRAIGHIRRRLHADASGRDASLSDLILAFQDRPDVQALLATAASDARSPADRRAWALQTIARTRLTPLPAAWSAALAGALHDDEPAVHRAAVRAAAVLQVPALDADLLRLADDPDRPADLRLEALRAAMPRRPEPSAEAFALLLDRLGDGSDPLMTLLAAELIGQARLDDDRRLRVLSVASGSHLIHPTTLRGAFRPPLGAGAAAAWLDYVERSLRAGWRPSDGELRDALDGLPGLPADRRDALLRANADARRERVGELAEYEALLSGGDPVRGRDVFFGKAAGCSACHRLGGAGGQVGPDLTRIGAVRSGRDLLESILWPSSTFAQGYEPYTLATTDGRVLGGTIARQDADIVVLRDASGAETRLSRDEVEELRRSETSPMPEGLHRVLARDELRDLLAFLQAQR